MTDGHVTKTKDTKRKEIASLPQMYEVQSGENLYNMAKNISQIGFREFVEKNPPVPPFKIHKGEHSETVARHRAKATS